MHGYQKLQIMISTDCFSYPIVTGAESCRHCDNSGAVGSSRLGCESSQSVYIMRTHNEMQTYALYTYQSTHEMQTTSHLYLTVMDKTCNVCEAGITHSIKYYPPCLCNSL